YQINPDGIAYLRIAGYWAEGKPDLALSGYWGPLFSWLMIPFLPLDDGPGNLAASRIAMVFSGLLFLVASRSVFLRLDLAPAARSAALFLTALFAAPASVETTSPDLLVSGLLLFLVASLFGSCWITSRAHAVRAGVIGGLAYLTKAAALPYVVALIAVIALLRSTIGLNEPARVARAAVFALAGIAAVALPWVVTLTVHYGAPTWSTSGGINHALIAPGGPPFRHPAFFQYHVPEAGRITKWEDPDASEYERWNPLASTKNLRYQVSTVYTNIGGVRNVWLRYDAIGFGLLCLFGAFLFASPWRETMRTERWRWCLLPALLLATLYLPVHVGRGRYFYLAYPMVAGASVGVACWIGSRAPNRALRQLVLALALLPFLLPSARGFARALSGDRAREGALAYALALDHVRNGGGPIASVNEQTGLYTAYFAGVPWYGSQPTLDPERLQSLRPALVVLPGPGSNRLSDGFPEVSVGPGATHPAIEELRNRGLTIRVIP
ncbi:MAG: hypothetical protein HKN20_15675, partial [Gemmatimonadetes bacterium]|nr:hypothetical protein [Gemmatimonadota bacterium]